MSTPPLILASASPRRRELLAALGVAFAVQVADVPEPLTADRHAADLAMDLAAAKAQAVAHTVPAAAASACLLGADTIVVLDGVPLGKPDNAAAAGRMLRALRDRPHTVVTGIALVADGRTRTDAATTTVIMRPYTDDEIARYIAGGDPFDKAGAYAIQHEGFHPVARIEGCYCNVMGLPLWAVRRLLATAAPQLITQAPDATYARCEACPLGDNAAMPGQAALEGEECAVHRKLHH